MKKILLFTSILTLHTVTHSKFTPLKDMNKNLKNYLETTYPEQDLFNQNAHFPAQEQQKYVIQHPHFWFKQEALSIRKRLPAIWEKENKEKELTKELTEKITKELAEELEEELTKEAIEKITEEAIKIQQAEEEQQRLEEIRKARESDEKKQLEKHEREYVQNTLNPKFISQYESWLNFEAQMSLYKAARLYMSSKDYLHLQNKIEAVIGGAARYNYWYTAGPEALQSTVEKIIKEELEIISKKRKS